MSILLEALKKSEAQRRLGETPTLQTPEDPDARENTTGRQWIPLLLVIVSMGTMAWMGWTQYQKPATSEVAPSTNDKSLASGDDEQGGGAVAGVDAAQSAHSTSASESEALLAQQSSPSDDSSDRARQTLGESFQSYAPDETDEAVVSASEKQAEIMAPKTTAGSRKKQASSPTTDYSRTNAEAAASAQTQSRPAVARGEIPATAEPEPETMSYWQIPQSLRDGMPEMRITVLVYAERPEERFLLVNGQRLREKDELDKGLVLEEIKRDRAIFSYRSYIFHLKS